MKYILFARHPWCDTFQFVCELQSLAEIDPRIEEMKTAYKLLGIAWDIIAFEVRFVLAKGES